MDVQSFAEIEEEFLRRITQTVWCSMATVDTLGRPRQRVIHPIWEGSTGWIATGRHSLKEKHLARVPYVALCYWDQRHEQVYVDAYAEWDDDPATKRRIWELYKSTPPPLGYDPQMIWQAGVDDPAYGVLKLTPTRIELFSLQALVTGQEPLVWRR